MSALYFASIEDNVAACCSWLYQKINLEPIVNKQPMVDFLISTNYTQLESTYFSSMKPTDL